MLSLNSKASLKRLKIGERGVIATISGVNPAVAEKLKRLGLSPGAWIALEQRSPRFVVRTRQGPLALTQAMIEAVDVRPQVA
ncbi:ferrous iron transport protein A [Acaryochloris sp. IP29b_bin.137]|uniref:ferrous iron transport protein A n=1 Tax=Acaryochloris sp. IP29b_bin.137 TaxID=2969217 RepID=UPI00260A576A|nr:ferrous iron transport protein A [Acaryochloris sp. IP29b_bin.137]